MSNMFFPFLIKYLLQYFFFRIVKLSGPQSQASNNSSNQTKYAILFYDLVTLLIKDMILFYEEKTFNK